MKDTNMRAMRQQAELPTTEMNDDRALKTGIGNESFSQKGTQKRHMPYGPQ